MKKIYIYMEPLSLLDIKLIKTFSLTSEYKNLKNLNNILDLKSDMEVVVVKSKYKDARNLNLNKSFKFIDCPDINSGDIIIDIANDHVMRFTELY